MTRSDGPVEPTARQAFWKRAIPLLLTLAVTVLLAAAATASHLSVGSDDAVFVQAEENTNDPSVSQDAYEVGISFDCQEVSEPDLANDSPEELVLADDFCGDLVYHEDVGALTVVSDPDQTYFGFVAQFDVMPTEKVPGVGSCLPYCRTQPGGETTWDLVHDFGAIFGLTHTADEADERAPDDRQQRYGAATRIGTAESIVQDETAAWRMNGWMAPSATRTFVAFLYDSAGFPIDPSTLESGVSTLVQNGDMHPDTVPAVCGWTPDADFRSTETRGSCEIRFTFVDAGAPNSDFRGGYEDECKSPTYVCGGFTGSYWKADVLCQGCGGHEQAEHFNWHWTVAHTPSDCGGLREPGFSFSTAYSYPYLAHDLDVYTPATDANVGQTVSIEGPRDYAAALGEQATDRAGLPGLTVPPLPGDRDEDVHEVLGEVENVLLNTSYRFVKEHRVEPNAGPMGSLDDTSQTISIERDDICETIATDETEATMDPWVNIVDSGAIGIGAGDYQNDDRHQDEHNNPTTGEYSTAGKVGMFSDKDDDGVYDQLASGQKYQGDQIVANGAYPMIWDVPLTSDGSSIDTTAGCRVEDTPIGKIAKDAGYGPETGLAQAIFLREPAVFTDEETSSVVPYLPSDNIFVLLGPSGRAVWDGSIGDGWDSNDHSEQIDTFVEKLQDFVTTNYDVTDDDIDVWEPGADLGLDSDFRPQCDEPTGGFDSRLSFTHTCEAGCDGDTIATKYYAEITTASGKVGGGIVPVFTANGDAYEFSSFEEWYDVDPFDGDGTRNHEESSRPPTGD